MLMRRRTNGLAEGYEVMTSKLRLIKLDQIVLPQKNFDLSLIDKRGLINGIPSVIVVVVDG